MPISTRPVSEASKFEGVAWSVLGKQNERSSRATTQQARHTSNRPRVQRLLEQMSNERPSHGAKQKLQYDDADFHSSSWVLVHHEVRTASSSSGSSQASLISSAHFLDDALLEPLLEMIGVPLANVHTSSCGESPHELVGASDERNRVNLRWVGLFLRTCKIIHASRTSIMKKILHFASTLGDARSISRFLVHTRWTTGGGMHEVCAWSLLSVTGDMSCHQRERGFDADQIFWCRQAAARCLAWPRRATSRMAVG